MSPKKEQARKAYTVGYYTTLKLGIDTVPVFFRFQFWNFVADLLCFRCTVTGPKCLETFRSFLNLFFFKCDNWQKISSCYISSQLGRVEETETKWQRKAWNCVRKWWWILVSTSILAWYHYIIVMIYLPFRSQEWPTSILS